MQLEQWINKFLEDGGSITFCKSREKKRHCCGGVHCVLPKVKKKKFKPVIVKKKQRLEWNKRIRDIIYN